MVMLQSSISSFLSCSLALLLSFFFFFFFFPKPSLLLSKTKFGLGCWKGNKNKGKGFIMVFLLAFSLCLLFGILDGRKMRRNGLYALLLATKVKTQFSSINPHTPIYSYKLTH